MKAIVVKDPMPARVKFPWTIELHASGCDCGCGAVDGNLGQLKPSSRRPTVGEYDTKKWAQSEADKMNHIDTCTECYHSPLNMAPDGAVKGFGFSVSYHFTSKPKPSRPYTENIMQYCVRTQFTKD
jgi:hypothetical protein